jgi:pilus assembly protein CpaB
MKPKAYIFAGLAIVCGLGASYMTSRLLAERNTDDPEKVEILVAKRNLSFGERIVKPEEMFELKAVTKENEPPDAIKDFEAVKGKMMRSMRNKGDHITLANLYDKDLLDIPEGHVAVGLPVSLATTAAGLASLPGSRVNLILTAKGADARSASSRVLLQNVLVLAADGRTNREGEIIAPAQVVTFALTQKDALKVSLAKELGILSLTLRKLNDPTFGQGDVVTGPELFEDRKPEEKALAQASPAPQPTPQVAPPVVVETKPDPKQPKAKTEEPKDIRSILIGNGSNQSQHYYEVLPNGQIRNVAPDNAPPATANPTGKGPREI